MESKKFRALFYGAGIGIGFGMALEKSKMYLPDLIRSQMVFETFQMMKVFLTATATGLAVISVLETIGIHQRQTKATSLGFGAMKGYGGNVVGGLILGAGITLCGACPGTVWAQLGAGINSAKYTLSGGILGAIAYGYIHGWINQHFTPKFGAKKDSPTVDKLVGAPYMFISAVLGSALMYGVITIEKFHPYLLDMTKVIQNSVITDSFALNSIIWTPIVGGIVIGSLQLPSVLFLDHPLGASSAYVTIASHLAKFVHDKVDEHVPIFKQCHGISDYGQLGSLFGIAVGSFLSTYLSGVVLIQDPKYQVSALTSFVGGFFMLFGARLAGGCASGHGISGLARLSIASVLTVCGMYAGGISTGFLLFGRS